MSDEREKCFVMMPISDQGDYPKDHFTKVYEQIIKPAVEDAGYEAYRVDENKISDAIMEKVFDAIQNCPMAVCDLSNRNPNVLYELGLRQAYDHPVVLIQDDKTERIFDVSAISTVSYNNIRLYENVLEARKAISAAITATKEGKNTSMVKAMKAKTADFDAVKVSNADKTQLMLTEIMYQISRMQENNEYSVETTYSNRCRQFNEDLTREIDRLEYEGRGIMTGEDVDTAEVDRLVGQINDLRRNIQLYGYNITDKTKKDSLNRLRKLNQALSELISQ